MTPPTATKKLIVMCGPSGAGKSSLVKKLMHDYPQDFGFSVSHTTRAPRPGEKDGVDYHYVDKETMEGKIKRNEMIEYAHVHTNIYGTSIQAVEDVIKTRRCILDIDVQGVEIVKSIPKINAMSLYIFVSPPNLEILEARLRSRGTETEDKIQKRLTNAKTEMEYREKPNFWHGVIINDDLDEAYTQLQGLIGLVAAPKQQAQRHAQPELVYFDKSSYSNVFPADAVENCDFDADSCETGGRISMTVE